MRRPSWPRLAGLSLLCLGLLFVPADLLVPPSEVPAFAVAGAVVAALGAPLVLRREEDLSVALPASAPVAQALVPPAPPPSPASAPAADLSARERARILATAIHDVRRMVLTLRQDDLLVDHIYRRLSKGIAEADALPRAAPRTSEDT
jgi:hypothetical protein